MRVRLPAALAVLVALVLAPILVPVTASLPATAALARAETGGAVCLRDNPASGTCLLYGSVPVDTEGTRDPVTGFTPGPRVCAEKNYGVDTGYATIDCEISGMWWSNSRQCYVQYDPVQSAPPPSADPAGAWYDCYMLAGGGGNNCDIGDDGNPTYCEYFRFKEAFFSATSPPGIRVMAPGQAAAIFAATFPLNAITIGLAPDPGVANSRTYVGVPVWMWAENPTPDTFGPYTESGTVGGLNITATATVTSLLWTMGDGSTVACATGGTPYDPGLGFTDSPNCGHRYSQTSAGQPGNRFPITATSQWDIVWSVGEVGGTINVTTVAESSVEVRELQSVNVGN
jgi:hypothetical protein